MSTKRRSVYVSSLHLAACGLEGLVEGVVLANPELQRAGLVERVVRLQVLDDVQQQVGSLDLDTDRVVGPGRHGNTGERGQTTSRAAGGVCELLLVDGGKRAPTARALGLIRKSGVNSCGTTSKTNH